AAFPQVAAEYFKNTTLLLVGVICVAAAVEKWNLHKRIALRMVMMAGAKPGMLLLCFMCCTTLLSMWLSNTSTTAMVMPIVEAVLQELVSAEDEQLVAGNSSAEEAEPISLDVNNSQPSLELIFVNEDTSTADFTSLMQNKNVNGVPRITNPVKTANPQGKKEHRSQEKPLVLIPGPRNQELNRKYKSQHDQMICKCLSLSISYAATIGGLTTIIGTSTSLIFLEHFNNQYPAAEVVNFGTWFLFSFPISLIMLVVSWFWMHWLFLGCNFRETCSLSKKKKTKREEVSEKRIQEEYEKLGAISYPEMVTGFFFILMTVLWFTREPGFVPGWDSFFEKKGYRTDATVSVFLGFLLFLIPAKKPCFGKKSDGLRDSGDCTSNGHGAWARQTPNPAAHPDRRRAGAAGIRTHAQTPRNPALGRLDRPRTHPWPLLGSSPHQELEHGVGEEGEEGAKGGGSSPLAALRRPLAERPGITAWTGEKARAQGSLKSQAGLAGRI
ncbi:solute carrier family 13 member 4-like, partial [Leptonychotes weddellii]|uniref:Solute carrier family 13 member 4-like n=1 Tax=Leptonychotes weddellii TaxID=9713 RepID=A0A7F8QVH2_LEPWE